MNHTIPNFKRYIFLIAAIFLANSVFADNPYVINIYRENYNAGNKNWAITQDEQGFIYFGNDMGLLEFDGIEWKLYDLPNNQTARSVAHQSHNTIFTGGYEEFGRWDRDLSGKLTYTSLSKNIDKSLFNNDDFWKIWVTTDFVYFQSFASIYIYDYKTVKRVPFDGGVLFLQKVRDEFFVQKILGELYRLEGDVMEKVEGSDIFRNTDVRVILPYGETQYLIGSTTLGLYLYDGKVFKEWSPELSKIMNSKELNCGILTQKGTYYLGTISDGIYEVDAKGQIIQHISADNALQNNTILSLYEDNLNNIWVALDRGIAYVQYVKNMSFYTDPIGSTGAIYDAVLWNDKLFLATNQGVYYINKGDINLPNALLKKKLIDGTQGQVWALKLINNKLYCCHNKGLKEINQNLSLTDSYAIGTGVYHIVEANIKNRDLLILSTYNSLRIIDPTTKAIYSQTELSVPITNSIIDHMGNIWLEYFNKGVFRCQLNDDFSALRSVSYYGGTSSSDKVNLPHKLVMFKVGGRIVLLGDDCFYTYDDITDTIVRNNLLNECFNGIKNICKIIHINDNMFYAITNKSLLKFYYDGYEAYIGERFDIQPNLSLVYNYENIAILNDTLNLICLDNGFILEKQSQQPLANDNVNNILSAPYLTSLSAINIDGKEEYIDVNEKAEIPYRFNNLTFNFSAINTFALNLSFEYKLSSIDKDWLVAKEVNSISYARLPEGNYEFYIRAVDNLGNYSETTIYKFKILSPWYSSIWAYLLYFFILLVALYVTWILVLKRYRNLHLQKIRSRETKRLKALAGELQNTIEQKNAELLTQTSFIIQKNELIFKIKSVIDDFYTKNKNNASTLFYQKINSLLNNNMDTDDDWKLFLIKFEEKHTGFFKKMKLLYPQLTTGDLRLCACLKLNLETKEIASLMNLSIKAVENNRYRLRKKLNLQSSQNLNDFLLSIS